MKARTPLIASSLLMLGAFCFSIPVFAQSAAGGMVPMAVTIKGSSTVARGGDGNNPVEKFTVTSSHWGLGDLLNLFSASSGISYPAGARLIFDGGDLMLIDKSGEVVEDLSGDGYLSLQLDVTGGGGAWSGQVNYDTGAAKFTGTYLSALTIDDQNGSTGTETGVTKETYSISAPDRNGNQRVSDSITMNLSGDGTLYGLYDVGTITLTAKGGGTLFNGTLIKADTTSTDAESSAP
jgi:hypothetical protein